MKKDTKPLQSIWGFKPFTNGTIIKRPRGPICNSWHGYSTCLTSTDTKIQKHSSDTKSSEHTTMHSQRNGSWQGYLNKKPKQEVKRRSIQDKLYAFTPHQMLGIQSTLFQCGNTKRSTLCQPSQMSRAWSWKCFTNSMSCFPKHANWQNGKYGRTESRSGLVCQNPWAKLWWGYLTGPAERCLLMARSQSFQNNGHEEWPCNSRVRINQLHCIHLSAPVVL